MAKATRARQEVSAKIFKEFFNIPFLPKSSHIDDSMQFLDYWYDFYSTLKEIRPGKNQDYTITDFLAVFEILPPELDELKKCEFLGDTFRDEANYDFASGRYRDAVVSYTRSLMTAPPNTECIAMTYANRSAALYRLKAYAECISDIERALDLPYPDDLRQKIITRKEEAEKNMNNSCAEDKVEAIEDELQLAYGPNAKLPEISKAIDIVQTCQEGLKLVAKTDFDPGDVLIIAKRQLAVAEYDQDPTYCHDCLKPSLCLIPCDYCCEDVYCSTECRIRAYEKYHRIECKIQSTLAASFPMDLRALLYQLRCLNIFTKQGANLKAILDDLKEIDDNSDSEKLEFTDEQFTPNSRQAFLNMLRNKNSKAKHNYISLFEAAYIATLLKNHTNFLQKNSDLPVVADIMTKINKIWPWNHFGIMYHGEKRIKARAAFPILGLVQHACVNNTITYLDKKGRIVIRASLFIRPGDEILHDYQQLHYTFQEMSSKSGRLVQCRRNCSKCDKSFSYPIERQPNIKIDKRLLVILEKNPFNIEALWKLLNIVRRSQQPFTLQTQVVKILLTEGYEQRFDIAIGHMNLYMLGVFENMP
ncbi:SET and MYND domain-containing protein 4-like [Neodiprion virginianus]|uniref:SET and MYND domain-containing protein 4-like n=1 Tax=Neodiprion virginianus TaxID=2961670 RepID=UPI001EE77F0F|nr:SET and MYND domain-containing protein 4-like [Neodiprion virginianus]